MPETIKPINQDADLDEPLTAFETLKMFLLCLLVPWIIYGPIFILGAFLRTYPDFPPLWPGFWILEITLSVSYLICFFLLRHHPRIIRTRTKKMKPDESDSAEERDFARIGSAAFVPGILLIPWDAVARHETFPLYLNIVGSACIVSSLLWTCTVFRQNKFAARVVFQQEGQQLITTGLYSIVRHPMYLGIIPMFIGLPICSGSYWGLIPMGLVLAVTGYRTFSEEDFLIDTFGDEYAKYREEVRYRMIPYVF